MKLASLHRAASYAGLAGHALRLRRASNDETRRRAERYVVQSLGRLRGLPQKLGQMLSFSLDDSADHEPNAYQSLQEHGEPLPLANILALLKQAWGRDPREVLDAIEPAGLAGSLGQVHRATLRDGREVAVKVQFPNIRDAIATDLKMLGWLSVPVGNLRRGFDLSGYRQVLMDNLDRELDYRQEANWHRRFAAQSTGSRISVPQVVDDVSTEQVLVTEWASGDTWEVARESWNENERRQVANALVNFVLDGLFVRGAMQADWHPGNLRFRRDADGAKVALFDLGSIFEPSHDDRLALARLIRATIRGDESPWPMFLKLGFDGERLEPLAEKLPALCKVLFEPFCVDAPYNLDGWHLSERIADVLGDDRWNFRAAGPANLLLLMRTLHGLTYYLRGLRTPVSWRRPFEKIAERWASEIDRLPLPAAAPPSCGFDRLAKYLKIRVEEDGVTKVALTSPAIAIEELDSLISADLRQKIHARGIDLSELVAEVRRRGYAPGPIFDMTDGQKRIEVTLA
jgi:predicted unusual protein kinase regulating ubiquinone biosynthesis (AarF/ABC1/UbiB family)